jgi:FAD/FMN-containing dehydrogenase
MIRRLVLLLVVALIGVVVVRSREDVVKTVDIARRHGSSITARGGGTSQAGQAIGPGLQLDTSKYFNRVLDVNVGERWARVEPGVVLDELNAELRPHGLRFAPDISTASRATVGGMMANNSSGARSVFYGKTIDHVLEQEVVLADGHVAHFRPLGKADLDAACTGENLEASCYRTVRRLATDCAQGLALADCLECTWADSQSMALCNRTVNDHSHQFNAHFDLYSGGNVLRGYLVGH